jgi:hypothetical protein
MENSNEQSSDKEIDWEETYKSGGYRAAVNFIFDNIIEDLDNSNLDVKITLTRFYVQMSKLKRLYKKDLNQKRKSDGKA